MTSLRFELNFKTQELRKLDLPVEIRKPNMVLVKRARTSETVEVEPGTYFVGIKMPAGQEAWSEVKVVEGDDNKVLLSPEPEDAFPSESHELQHYFTPPYVAPPQEGVSPNVLFGFGAAGAAIAAFVSYSFADREFWVLIAATVGAGGLPLLLSKVVRPAYASVKRRMREATLRDFKGNVLLGRYGSDKDWSHSLETIKETDNLTEITVKGENHGQIIQLLQSGEPAVNVVLPAWSGHLCRVMLNKLPDGRYSLEVHLQHTEAELLLRYWEQGLWQHAAAVTESSAVSAQRLLKEKRQHPIAAAVGAYALLRLGELKRLHDWSQNLMDWFEWLPDGAAIRGEHLARVGEHKGALRAFCMLQERGLPYFSDGLSYAVDRLRLYRSLGEKHFKAEELRLCETTLALLEPFCLFTDFGKPVVTFTGLDPSKPDAKPVGVKLKSYGGIDVARLSSLSHAKESRGEIVVAVDQ